MTEEREDAEVLWQKLIAADFWLTWIADMQACGILVSPAMVDEMMDAIKNHSPEASSSGLRAADFDKATLERIPHFEAAAEKLKQQLRPRHD